MPPDLGLGLTLISSNYPCFEHNFMGPKEFEPLKLYCISDLKVYVFLLSAGGEAGVREGTGNMRY